MLRKTKTACIALAIALLPMVACSQTETITWKEEVALHDGKTIVVERSMTLGGRPHEIGQGPIESNYTLKFQAPDGTEVSWENAGHLSLMILDFKDGVPYLATHPAMVIDYERYGCPDPAYVFFKYIGEWQRIAYQEFPTEFLDANLSPSLGEPQRQLIRTEVISAKDVVNLVRMAPRDLRRINPNKRSPAMPCFDANKSTPR